MFKPRKNYVLIKRDEYPTKTQGGIELPINLLNQPPKNTGTVIQIGSDVNSKDLHSGSHVFFPPHAGYPVDTIHLLIEEHQVIAIEE